MNVPKLRFKEFNDEYKTYKFYDVAKLCRGSSPRPIINFITKSEDCVNWIKIGDVSPNETYINRTSEKITKEGAKKSRRVYKGEIILSNSMSFGRPYILNLDGCIHDGWFVVRDYEKLLNKEYLYHFMCSPLIQKQYKTLSAGGVVSNISSELVYSVKLNIPSKEEQLKIAKFLSLLDKKIELQSKKIEDLKLFKKGLSNNIFNNLKNFEEYKLGDLCNITTGKLDANAMVENGKYRFYTCAKEYSFIDEYSFDTEALLISGNGAYVGYIHYYNGKFNAYQRTYVLDQFSQNIQFIKCYLDENLSRRIKSEKKEGNTPYIVLSTLSDMIIKVPSKENQKNISNIINYHQKKILLEENKLQKLQELKKGLMQNMFV